MKSAIIFDFDYTLADSSKGVVACINYALRSMGETPRPWEACCATIGLSLPATYASLTGESHPERAATFHRLFVERADQIMASRTALYAGVSDVIHGLASSGFVLGIVSTKFRYRIRQILDRYALTEPFAVIVGGEDVTQHKPDPEGIQLFLSETAVKPEQAVLVGDSLTDAETARRSGVDFVAVLTGTTVADQFAAYAPKTVLASVRDMEKYAEQYVAADTGKPHR
jgi:phosphoglycolate phosphatase